MQGSIEATDTPEPAEESGNLTHANRRLILVCALIQGLALYGLKFFDAVENWSPVWQYVCYTLVIALPPLVIATTAPRVAHSARWVIAGYGAVLALVAAYRGYQCTPADTVFCGAPTAYAIAIIIATFILAFLLRASATNCHRLRRPDYPALFHYSWDNALTAALTLAFTGIFWLILFLWQALFRLVGVDVFHELFRQDWFIYPVTWLVAGCGVILFRAQQSFVLTLKRLLRTMLVALLPLLALLTVVFLATLPFTGLQPIWDTGHGSALLLWLVALLLFFTNGVIQDEFPFARYPKWINRLLLLAVALAPVYAIFALYGLFLRVQQYGWTPERLWGSVVALTLALLATGYSLAILRQRSHWSGSLRRINTGLAFWVLAICLLTHTPLLNFWQISAQNQAARLADNKVAPAEFDFFFLRRQLGRPGVEALREIQGLAAVQQNPNLATYVEALLASREIEWQLRENPLQSEADAHKLSDIPVLPAGALLPEAFSYRRHGNDCGEPKHECVWLAQDLDSNGEPEYLLFIYTGVPKDGEYWLRILAYANEDGEWQVIASSSRQTEENFASLRERLASGQLNLRPSHWQSLYIGDELLFDPTRD
ncbi:DUF4153 domain-containing protein [Microbulbifer aggregans]|uniref:DUF4153 domain-containing protein n=1 Tax=Microbulbifer aggregans TaxID=1769779 RepID=UPI001CFF3389|nr:DUF4153 domain-containing protein [Microbulbifer aggregans]